MADNLLDVSNSGVLTVRFGECRRRKVEYRYGKDSQIYLNSGWKEFAMGYGLQMDEIVMLNFLHAAKRRMTIVVDVL